MYTSRLEWEELRILDSATLSGSYVALGDPLEFPSYKLKLTNLSNRELLVSFDGTTNHDVVGPGGYWLYDFKYSQNQEVLPARSQVYVSGSAGTGNIYLTQIYIEQN